MRLGKAAIAEYIDLENEKGEAVGHSPKALEESANLLKKHCTLRLICSDALKRNICSDYETVQVIGSYHKMNKALMFVNRWKNLNRIFDSVRDCNMVWFTNVDWVLFFYLAFKKGVKTPIVVTLYRDIVSDMKNYRSGIRKLFGKLCLSAMGKIALYVVTNPSLNLFDNQIILPDFYYSEKYDGYSDVEKKEHIVCLGAMRGTKDLEGVVKHFNGTDVKVIIAGDFMYKDEYQHLVEIAEGNISIEDKVLPSDKYYRMIAESKYTLLPYKIERYENATSGILLESLFLKSIPIAPKWLLENNNITGIAYDKLNSLPRSMSELNNLVREQTFDIEDYKKENVEKKLMHAIEEYVL